MSSSGLPPSLKLRRPSEFVARRSLGGAGTGRPSIAEAAVLEPRCLWNTGFPACAGNDSGETRLRSPAAWNRPGDAKRCPSEKAGGRRECRVHDAPTALRANKKDARRLNTGTPKSPGTPCAMGLRLLRARPGEPAGCHRRPGILTRGLSPALAGQDHTA